MYIPPVNPQRIVPPSREIYAAMGQENITRMFEAFYVELEKSAIRAMFPDDMRAAAHKSAKFFAELFGGPPLYQERYGRPMMRARHLPFPISRTARDEWLACFERVLDDAPARYHFPPEHLEGFREFLRGFSLWMMNSEE